MSLLFILMAKGKDVSKVLPLLMLVPFAASASMTTYSRSCNCIRERVDKALKARTSLFAALTSCLFLFPAEHQRRPPAAPLYVRPLHLCLPLPQHLEASEPHRSSGRTIMCLLKEFLQKTSGTINQCPAWQGEGEGWEKKGQWHIFAMQLLWQEEMNGLVAVPVLIPPMDPSSGTGSEFCLSGLSKPVGSTNRKTCHQGSVKHEDGGN